MNAWCKQMDTRVIEKSKKSYLFLFALSLLMTIASIFVVWHLHTSDTILISQNFNRERNTRILLMLFGIIGIIWFSWNSLVILRMTFSDAPLLSISKDSLINYSVGVMHGKEVHFSNIKKVYRKSNRMNTYICITLKDESDYLNSLSIVGKWMAKMNKKMGFEVCLINLNNASETVDVDQVIEDIKNRIKEYKQK